MIVLQTSNTRTELSPTAYGPGHGLAPHHGKARLRWSGTTGRLRSQQFFPHCIFLPAFSFFFFACHHAGGGTILRQPMTRSPRRALLLGTPQSEPSTPSAHGQAQPEPEPESGPSPIGDTEETVYVFEKLPLLTTEETSYCFGDRASNFEHSH